MYKESNLGCDCNEKEAQAQICSETPLIPKGVIISSMAAGRSQVAASTVVNLCKLASSQV